MRTTLHPVERESWNEVEYVLNRETDEFEENIIAGFTQYPIRLFYVITIHKSQGKTFDKITVDVGTGAFAHGQVYVALSRCKSLNVNIPQDSRHGVKLQKVVNCDDEYRRKHYDREFKQKAVELSFARGDAREIAEELGIRSELIY